MEYRLKYLKIWVNGYIFLNLVLGSTYIEYPFKYFKSCS